MPGYNRYLQQTTQTTGVFLQNEWNNDRFNILLGGRFDTHNLLNNMVFSPRVNLKYNFTGTYTGSMLAPHFAGYITSDRLEKTPAFVDMNLKATYDVRLNGIAMQLSVGAKNIFNSCQTDLDKDALRDAGYVYGPSLPRSFFVGLKFSN